MPRCRVEWRDITGNRNDLFFDQAIKRNANRFPDDFVFRLTPEEKTILRSQSNILNRDNRSQSVTCSQKHRDPRYLPYVFTEHVALMDG